MRNRSARAGVLLAGLAAGLVVTPAPAAADADTERVTVDIFGGEPNGDSGGPTPSDDGRYVAYVSEASDLVETDANGLTDVFRTDRATGSTVRASIDAAGGDPNGRSTNAGISDDGQVVAFESAASDLAPGDGTPGEDDVFVRDLVAGTTVLANVLPNGSVADLQDDSPFDAYELSGDGRHVAFATEARRVYLRDLDAGTTVLVADGIAPTVDDDGTRVAFETNKRLVPEDTDNRLDVYVWDQPTGAFTRASESAAGGNAGALSETARISGDGTAVAFISKSWTLVTSPPQTDGDVRDLFVRDLVAGTTVQVSVTADGTDTNKDFACASLSDDGELIAFCSNDRDLTPDPDGPTPNDIFLRSLDDGRTAWVSSDRNGEPANGESHGSALSGDGATVVFSSEASDLVEGDGNPIESDVFATGVARPPPPRPVLAAGAARVLEGGNGRAAVAVPVVLSRPAGGPVTVDWATEDGGATAPSDYDAASGTLTIPAGTVAGRVDVVVRGDADAEGNESLTVHLSGADGAVIGTPDGTVTLVDDELPTLAIGDVVAPEGSAGEPHVAVPVRLSAPAATEVTASFTTVDGTALAGLDYEARSGTITIPAGRTSARVEIALVGDTADGLDERFTVDLSAAQGAHLTDGSGQVTLRDDDPSSGLTVAVGDVAAPEGDTGTGQAQFPVVLSQPAASDVVVDWATSDGTAVAPGDYTAAGGSVTIPAGGTWAWATVRVAGDHPTEPDETFTVRLTDVSAGTVVDATGAGTIVDDDADRLVSVGDLAVAEGDEGSATAYVTIVLDRPAFETVRVDWATVDGSATAGEDYFAAAGTATFRQNRRSAVVAVPLVGDVATDTADETFSVVLSSPVRADVVDPVGVVTIVDGA